MTRGEEGTLKKVGSAEMKFRGKMDHSSCRGEVAVIMEKVSRLRSNRGTHKENVSPTILAWKTRRNEFCEFLQPAGLTALQF